jgi:hypothetical protein
VIGLLLVGCRAHQDAKLAELPLERGDLVAVFPPDGAEHLSGDVPVEVVLGSKAEGTLPEVTLTRGGVTTALSCELSYGGNVADCGSVDGVQGESLALSVTAGADALDVVTVARLPKPGLGWSLLDGPKFTQFGGGSEAVTLVNSYLAQGSAFLALDHYAGDPGPYVMVGGPSGDLPDGGLAIADPGLGFVLPVQVGADGSVHGAADTAWLPIPVSGQVVHLLLLDVTLDGTLDGDRLTKMTLGAELPAISLEDLVTPLGSLGSDVLDLIQLDVDRDGDGTNDAATIRVEGEPAPASLAAWSSR